jgi:hypothetical protein
MNEPHDPNRTVDVPSVPTVRVALGPRRTLKAV